MTLRGRIKNGGVVLDQPAPLPEGTEVLVHAVEEPAPKPPPAGGPSIWDKLLELEGTAQGLPSDLPERHDAYRRRRVNP
jgi:hypothetical protein